MKSASKPAFMAPRETGATYETPTELRAGLTLYFEFYNTRRHHSALDRYGIVTLIVLARKGPHGFPFRRPHGHFPIH